MNRKNSSKRSKKQQIPPNLAKVIKTVNPSDKSYWNSWTAGDGFDRNGETATKSYNHTISSIVSNSNNYSGNSSSNLSVETRTQSVSTVSSCDSSAKQCQKSSLLVSKHNSNTKQIAPKNNKFVSPPEITATKNNGHKKTITKTRAKSKCNRNRNCLEEIEINANNEIESIDSNSEINSNPSQMSQNIIDDYSSPIKPITQPIISPNSSPVQPNSVRDINHSNDLLLIKSLDKSIQKLSKFLRQTQPDSDSLSAKVLSALREQKQWRIESQLKCLERGAQNISDESRQCLTLTVTDVETRYGLRVCNAFVTNNDNENFEINRKFILVMNTQLMDLQLTPGFVIKLYKPFTVTEFEKFGVITNAFDIKIVENVSNGCRNEDRSEVVIWESDQT